MAHPALIAAAPAIVGSVASAIGQRSANRQNLRIAREQMAFQERMSNTAYQRAVTDMRMAGINPMLAYQQGGASSPGGASAQMQNVAGVAASSAQHAARLAEDIKNMRRQRELLFMQTARERGTANREQTQAHLNETLEREAEARIRNIDVQTQMGRYGLSRGRAESQMWDVGGQGLGWANAIMRLMPSALRFNPVTINRNRIWRPRPPGGS